MTFQQALIALKARWWVALLTLVVCSVLGFVVTELMTPKFTSTATVLLDPKSSEVTGQINPAGLSPTFVGTQVEIVTSHRVALKVAKNLKLADNAKIREQFLEATKGRGSIDDWAADFISTPLKVKPAKEGTLLELEYKHPDPRYATAMANGFAQAYIDTTLELKNNPAKDVAHWFDGQLKTLRADLERAQQRLSEFQRNNGIVATDERIDVENSKLQELTTQVITLQGQSTDLQGRQRQVEDAIRQGRPLDDIPEVANNGIVMGLRTELVRTEGKLKEMQAQFGDNYPAYQRAVEEAGEVRRRLKTEMQNIAQTVANSAHQASQREGSARSQAAAQKARVLEIKHQRDELQILLRDQESAQRGYDSALARFTQTSMESQSGQTNVALLTPAVEPLYPSSPRMLVNMLVAGFVGTMLGIGLAIGLELIDARIRSGEDVADSLGLVLLGSLEKAKVKKSSAAKTKRSGWWSRRGGPGSRPGLFRRRGGASAAA